MTGEKRFFAGTDERLELGSKKPKTWDLSSAFCSGEQIREEAAEPVVDAALIALDLNANVDTGRTMAGNETHACVKETNEVTEFRKQEFECEAALKSKAFGLDLNTEDVSSSIINDHFHACKNLDRLKSKDDSECASSVGPVEERDPLQVWKEMKKNGFLSASHGVVSMPKPKGRKLKTDGVKKKLEIAKREQVDRFAKISAPSGLLNGLNPGIINHVRNSKQVHSIIEALVKSEENESLQVVSKPGSQTKFENKEFSELKYGKYVMHNPGENKLNQVSQLLEPQPSYQMKEYPGSTDRSVSTTSNFTRGDGPSCMIGQQILGGTTDASQVNSEFQDGVLELKLSSSTRVRSEIISSLSNEDSANITSVNSLSVKAASVASQWLELLHQDVKGRLAALRRSKKRIHEVIHTELRCMLYQEFPYTEENNLSTNESFVSHSNSATAEIHRTRWSSLFHQMEKTLLEEEIQLENWLGQVKQMQVHCDLGLFNYNAANVLPQIDRVDVDCSPNKAEKVERDLSVRAAAASIYSTCNFLSSMENLPCR